MDRNIVYPSQVLLDTDVLSISKNAMVGLGYALQDILGTNNVFAGLPCTQTTVPSLAVMIGPGRAYSLQNVDGTPYGSLPADTADQIVKQGIQLGSVTLATPAPATAGQSIDYLIEAQYQDLDTTPVVLPFYNATNPQVAFSGPGNSGAQSNTQRKGMVVLQVKAGIPAATGSQALPAPDAGFTGLYAVTVANGQTAVTSANITLLQSAPFLPSNLGSPLVSHLASTFSTSTTALANTGLGVNLGVGTYAIEMLLNLNAVSAGTNGGLNLSVLSGSSAGFAPSFGLGGSVGSVNGSPTNVFFPGTLQLPAIVAATIVDFLTIKFSIAVTSPGSLILQASQHSASGIASQILASSYMTATKV
jgi:hypothetical protein